MASTKPYNCAMHCHSSQYHLVNNLATRIILQGMYVNTGTSGVFVNIPIVLTNTGGTGFKDENDKLTNYIAQAKGNKVIEDKRDTQSILVHGMLEQLIAYADPICAHDVNKINQSGFDPSN